MGVVRDVIVLVLVAAVGVLLIKHGNRRTRRMALAWPPPGQDRFDPATLTGEQLGYLSDRGNGAIEAAVARLRVGGAVTYRWSDNTLAPTGRGLPDGSATPLSTAVLSAASEQPPIGGLGRHPAVRDAVRDLGGDLDDTWKRTDVPPRHFVSCGIPVLLLSAATLAWAVLVPPFRAVTDVPLILLAVVGLVAGAVVGSQPVPMETIRLRTLRRARERNTHLDPGMNPALRTYGPAAAAVAVGLFGLSAMVDTDLPLSSVSVRDQTAEADAALAAATYDDEDGRPIYGCGGFDAAGGGGGGGSSGAGCGVWIA
ncbi:hypothetical protein GCM10009557_90540 [Virgisporangium ochraceum]|uniref:TIGR04222 domain-containing membrane protein n=1 Tax=Virgisporangium ochraceum TaxID=65505 RepID=A0A8J4A345_9ACTN|nr:TIGR04222 domain-containing membrane protein [Virgisporangium ochraceum]GIJ74984.1 hypothetical protein Voc01_099010 [Virgisporangium ochraceum]